MSYAKWVDQHLQVGSRMGNEYLCRCIFHEDKGPSMAVNVIKGLFVCYGCGEKGSIKKLMRKVGVEVLPDVSLMEVARGLQSLQRPVTEPVKVLPEESLVRFNTNTKRYDLWESRGISARTVDLWGLGYDRDTNSMTVPLRDMQGRLLGVIRRRMDKHAMPRYLYPEGFKMSWHLFGAWQVRSALETGRVPSSPTGDGSDDPGALQGPFRGVWRQGVIALTEGSIDALAMWEVGMPAVALLGSRISTHQESLIRKLNPKLVVVATDNDDPGRAAATKVVAALKPDMLALIAPYKKQWPKDPAALSVEQRIELVKGTTGRMKRAV